MKKYLQAIVVLGGFFLAVFLRNARGSESPPVVGGSSQNSSPTTSPSQGNSTPPTSTPPASSPPSTNQTSGKYKDGTYTGDSMDAYYGFIQVKATIAGGKITDVVFLDYPQDNPTSRFINSQAMPLLRDEAIQAQSSEVDIVSGASDSSQAFRDSLASALQKAS